MEDRRKVYVEVRARHLTDGTCRPESIKFENDEVYEIDRVKHCCRAASTKVGGTGLRYTVMICGKETYLFDAGVQLALAICELISSFNIRAISSALFIA